MSPPHRRSSTTHRHSSTTGRLPHFRSRCRSRFLRFLRSQHEQRSRFLQSQREQELRLDSTSRDWHPLLPQSLDVTYVGAQLQHEDQESGSELNCPPRITMFLELEKEPGSPNSPTFSPSSPFRVNTGMSGDWQLDAANVGTHSQHQGEQESGSKLDWSPEDSPNDEDQYFNYLVDNFVSVAADVCNPKLPGDETDYTVEMHRQSVLCAESALKHYNNDEKNKIKYELISVTVCNDILIREGCFSHVNFTAKANEPNGKEELFFAELRWNHVTPEPTCVICFKGIKKVGGLCDTKYDNFYLEALPVDKQHCYACDHQLKHPKNGELYNIGHIAMSKHYCFS